MENSDSGSVDSMPWTQLPLLTSSFGLPGIAIGQLLPRMPCAPSWLEGMDGYIVKTTRALPVRFQVNGLLGLDQIPIPAVTFVLFCRRQDNTNVYGGDTVTVPIPAAAEGDTLKMCLLLQRSRGGRLLFLEFGTIFLTKWRIHGNFSQQ